MASVMTNIIDNEMAIAMVSAKDSVITTTIACAVGSVKGSSMAMAMPR
jgi:hypothetical protein